MVRTYEAWANALCAPIFWEDGQGQTLNGTITLLHTAKELLGITNAHVADALANCTDQIGNRCQIGGAYLDPARLMAKHPSLDLATFRLSSVVIGQIALLNDGSVGEGFKHQAATVTNWPPAPPIEGAPVMYGGFPGAYRKKLDDGNVNFGFFWFATKVQSVSEKNIGMVIERESSVSIGEVVLPDKADLGGWSGGPVFRIVEQNLLETLELCGVIYEYSAETGIVLAHPLTDLNPDGTFN